jgi:hypothetical protein
MSRPTKAAKLRRPVAGSQIHMTCRVVGADRPQAAAPPVAGSCIFDPSLLLGDQALHELGPFFLVGLNTFVKEHFADLRQSPLLVVRYAL